MSANGNKIDSVYDFTDRGLVELKAWLEPWFESRARPDETTVVGGSGIFFDTTPQEGGFLEVTTTTSTGIDMTATGGNIDLDATPTGGARGIITLDGRLVNLNATENVNVYAEQDFEVLANSGQIDLNASQGVRITSGGSPDAVELVGGDINIDGDAVEMTASVAAGLTVNLMHASAQLFVRNNSSVTIFRIDQDGSLHGRTGKSLVFDL